VIVSSDTHPSSKSHVEGHCKELGYVTLSELEAVRGPMGLPVERDLYWKAKTLEAIAPEIFGEGKE